MTKTVEKITGEYYVVNRFVSLVPPAGCQQWSSTLLLICVETYTVVRCMSCRGCVFTSKSVRRWKTCYNRTVHAATRGTSLADLIALLLRLDSRFLTHLPHLAPCVCFSKERLVNSFGRRLVSCPALALQ